VEFRYFGARNAELFNFILICCLACCAKIDRQRPSMNSCNSAYNKHEANDAVLIHNGSVTVFSNQYVLTYSFTTVHCLGLQFDSRRQQTSSLVATMWCCRLVNDGTPYTVSTFPLCEKWRHPQNWNYIKYIIGVRGGPSHGHR